MGALNRLDEKEGRTKATERWVRFVNRKPEIEGLDIHPHVDSLQAAGRYVQYVVSRLDKSKKFLATEFSLVRHWENHMRDKIPAAYAVKYKVPPNTRVWQVIGNAFEKPFPQKRWDDFLAMSPWFASHKDYLTQQVQMFRETGKLAVATYGVVQIESMQTGWDADKKPWILNPCTRTALSGRRTEGPDGPPSGSTRSVPSRIPERLTGAAPVRAPQARTGTAWSAIPMPIPARRPRRASGGEPVSPSRESVGVASSLHRRKWPGRP